VKLQSSSNYLYKNKPQSNPSSASIRPDCSKLIIREMPHAHTRHGPVVGMHYGSGLSHLLAFQPLHPLGLVGGVSNVLGLGTHAAKLRVSAFAISLDSKRLVFRQTRAALEVQATEFWSYPAL